MADRLGTKVDSGITETVTAFRLLGINTVSSCSGHMDRITGGPYVMFEDPTVAPLVAKMRTIGDPRDAAFQQIRQKIVPRNLKERQKLLPLLDAFYQTRRSIPYENRIIIESVGPEGSCVKIQGAEMAHVVSPANARRMLSAHQAEMHAFTSYVKESLLAARSN